MTFKEQILQGIPKQLPRLKLLDSNLNPAPKRKQMGSVCGWWGRGSFADPALQPMSLLDSQCRLGT